MHFMAWKTCIEKRPASKIGFRGVSFDKHHGRHMDIDFDEGKRECDLASHLLILVGLLIHGMKYGMQGPLQ